MACGCHVIGYDIGCLPEYINEGITGFLFDPGNSHELEERIFDFYKLTEKQRNTMRLEAIRYVDKYESRKISQALINKIKEI